MPPSSNRQFRGRLAIPTFLLVLLVGASASAGIRDVRVSGDAPVRAWASRKAPAVEVVRGGSFVTLQGEVRAPWFQVKTTTGKRGWIAGSLVDATLSSDEGLATKPTELSGSLRLVTAAKLRGGPVAGRPVQHELGPGTIVRVLDQYGTWLQLGDSQGRSGWVELSDFVAASVEADSLPAPKAEVRMAETKPAKTKTTREARETEPEVAEEDDGRLTGAELREARLEERRAQREAERESADEARAAREAEREARRLEREKREAEKDAERAERIAAREAEQEAERAAREAEAAAAAAEREAAAAAQAAEDVAVAESGDDEDAARLAREAEREAARAAKQAEREARAAEKRAAREAREAERLAEKEARAAEKRAAREAKETEQAAASEEAAEVRDGSWEQESEPELDRAEARRLEREAAAARKAEEKAARDAERAERDAEKEARRAAKRGEDVAPRQPEAEIVQVQEIPSGPVEPADIPPSLGVSLGKKAPAEKKPDPGRSPLAREALSTSASRSELPVLDLAREVQEQPPTGAAAELLEGFQPYSEDAQVERSVDAVHQDPGEAMELSFAERPAARPSAFYVTDEGDMVDTRIVSEIVLRVGAEILTLSEFDRRVDEYIESESRRTGRTTSLDEARRAVMRDLVNDLVLVHHGRAIGIRFDAVYESAKEEFKQRGGITDDLELLRILDDMDMTFKDFRRDLIRRTVPGLVIRTQVMSDVTIADEEIENYYRRHQDEWVQEDCVLLRELVLQPEARETTRDFNLRLEEILDRLEAGEDFCDLARRHSRSPSAAECGQLEDCFVFEQLDEKVARVVFKMRPGDIEPIRTDWGYHLLRLEEHRPRRVRTLDEVRSGIVRKLQGDRLQAEIPRYLEELLRSLRVEVSPAFRRYWDGAGSQGGLGQ